MSEPAEVRLVDANELRRRIDGASAGNTDGTPWGVGRRYGLRIARGHLDAMPPVTAPKGWTRDEVLAELAKHPDNVCERLDAFNGQWLPMSKVSVERWRNPEVRRLNVRVVRSTPDPEWVPLTKLVGRTIHGCDERVGAVGAAVALAGGWRWRSIGGWHDFPDGTLNPDDATVAVRPEATT